MGVKFSQHPVEEWLDSVDSKSMLLLVRVQSGWNKGEKEKEKGKNKMA